MFCFVSKNQNQLTARTSGTTLKRSHFSASPSEPILELTSEAHRSHTLVVVWSSLGILFAKVSKGGHLWDERYDINTDESGGIFFQVVYKAAKTQAFGAIIYLICRFL